MKDFRFRLQRVLDLHLTREKGEIAALAAALGALRAAEARREDLARWQRDALRALEAALGGAGFDARDLRRRHVEIEACDEEIRRVTEQARGAELQVRTCQEVLRARRKDRKAMETLKDQARSLHDAEARRLEGRQMDEVAGVFHARQGGRREPT